jgi:hypothetical protein
MTLSMTESLAVSSLAKHLYDFLPASGNNATSFPISAQQAGIPEAWPTFKVSKLPGITHMLTSTLEIRRDRFTELILSIVKQSITWRKGKETPLSRHEVEELNRLLLPVRFKIPELCDEDFLKALAQSSAPVPSAILPTDIPVSEATYQELIRKLLELAGLQPQPRGYAFEKFLVDLFLAFEPAPRGAFRLLGEQIPQSIPRIIGAQVDGGFLADPVVQFSPNLNCIIGGRGTGKSTIFESIRCIAGGESTSKVIDSDVWPNALYLFWQDQAGQRHCLLRQKECAILNTDDDLFGPTEFEVDCFGQGEAAKISYEAQTDPLALLRYLDKFVDVTEASEAEEATREQLLALQTKIEKAEQQVELIPQHQRLLATTQQQLAALQKPEVKDLIELHRQLATERELRTQILSKLEEAKESAERETSKDAIKDISELANPADLSVGAAEFQAIHQGAITLESAMATVDTQIKAGLTSFEKIVTAQISHWKRKDSDAQKKVDDKRRELEALKVQFDMSYIAKLTRDEANHQQNIRNLNTWKPHLANLKQQRGEALKARWTARERVATIRDAFGRKATQTLEEALSDLRVSLKYARNAYSPDAEDQIVQAMGWRTSVQQFRDG